MTDEIFRIQFVGHNWLRIKDIKNKPEVKLVDTISIEIKDKSSLALLTDKKQNAMLVKIFKEYPEELMRIMAELAEDLAWFGVNSNLEVFKDYDYVVPCKFTDMEEFFTIDYDCFRLVKKGIFKRWKK
jgi:hypothetical protein